jgi:drug/metabolite transporter (DMT)-like permease
MRGWRIQFLLLSATWGSSFLFIKVLGRHLPALWIAFGRVSLGALTLLVLIAARRERLPRGLRTWGHLAIAGALFNAVPFTLYAFAEKHVPSVIAGLWNATTPLWVLAFALAAFPEEHPDRQKGTGLALGFLGVIVLLGPWRGFSGGELEGQLACAGAAMCYGLAFLHTRRYLSGRAETGIALSGAQLLTATMMLACALPFTGAAGGRLPADAIASLLTLGVIGTGIAYVFNYAVVRAAGATIASTVTYLIPVFSTLLGVVVLSEGLSWNQPAGAVVLLSGIAVSQGRLRRGGGGPDGRGARTRSRPRAESRTGTPA